MKKITLTLVLAIGYCFTGFSQSNNGKISGYFTIILGQTSTFSINSYEELNSYEWEVNNNLTNSKNKKSLGTLNIVGNSNEKILTVEPTTLGVFSVQVVYTDKKGYHTASFIGNVVSPSEITTESSLTSLDESKKQK
ncbi:hypothetical protein FIA58_000020 [Flavobacterium jejuense]|uniref:PKD domain-containing protein n=1 Tax=Flavobacterium jejuense TaxID=1544455 RepID=A0ABX0IJQ2_9FLAO|nr:hypothetical protein [Flavobacterium jejuense]NHN24047.1 hypothetical protein [Flavobacterium jejuense]